VNSKGCQWPVSSNYSTIYLEGYNKVPWTRIKRDARILQTGDISENRNTTRKVGEIGI
jgi:hypothetical protein